MDTKSKIIEAVRARAGVHARPVAPPLADSAYDRAQARVEQMRAKVARDFALNVDAEVEAQFCVEVDWIGGELRRVAALEDRLERLQILCALERDLARVSIALTILWMDAAGSAEQTAD